MKTLANKFPSYLFKSQHDIYYFRVRIPKSVKIKYNTTKSEIRQSLGTKCLSFARKKAMKLWVEMEETDYAMKSDDEIIERERAGRKLLKDFLKAEIESENLKDFFADGESSLDEFIGQMSGWSKQKREMFDHAMNQWNSMPEDERREYINDLKSEIELVDLGKSSEKQNKVHRNGDIDDLSLFYKDHLRTENLLFPTRTIFNVGC